MKICDYLVSKGYISLRTKSTIVRFVKMFIISGLSAMAALASFTGNSWRELGTWLAALGFAFVVGGITGVVAGYEKWANWTDAA